MQIDYIITPSNAIQAHIATSMAQRRLNLIAPADGIHPLQALAAAWSNTTSAFNLFAKELRQIEPLTGQKSYPNLDAVVRQFRELTYATTELFDVYAQLIPGVIRAN